MNTCKDCRFYREHQETHKRIRSSRDSYVLIPLSTDGECHRFPPQTFDSTQLGIRGMFAEVDSDDWCGEFQSNQEEKDPTREFIHDLKTLIRLKRKLDKEEE